MKVLELFSGIGGMHFALKETEIDAHVVTAIDINPRANEVYKLNFPNVTLLEKNIQSLSELEINSAGIDMIIMSPPCQPFTRNGLKRDMKDNRNTPILHIIGLIPKLTTVAYILLENVQGFESSKIRQELIHSLAKSAFVYQEFLLTPTQFGIPNSRLRYYLLAKKLPLKFCFTEENRVMLELPLLPLNITQKIKLHEDVTNRKPVIKVESILSDTEGDLVSDKTLQKYGSLFDIVTRESVGTCCFTKSYTSYVEGTGSVFTPKTEGFTKQIIDKLQEVEKGSDEYLKIMKLLKLRYFSPSEVSRFMSFPNNFVFPSHMTNKQKYKLLGNSINVQVVKILILILVS